MLALMRLLLVWLLIGCGGEERRDVVAPAPPPVVEEPREEPREQPTEEATTGDVSAEPSMNIVVGRAINCTLARAVDGGLDTWCPAGVLSCTVVARGDLSPDTEDDDLYRCEHTDTLAMTVIVLSRTVIWAAQFGRECREERRPRLELRVVDAVASAPQELLVRRDECVTREGRSPSSTTIFAWRGGGLEPIAEAAQSCAPTDETGPHRCSGSTLEVSGDSSAPIVTEIEYEEGTARPRVRARHTLRWNEAGFRLARDPE